MSCDIFFLQSGDTSQWRVCYQRGLPRLVSMTLDPSDLCLNWLIMVGQFHSPWYWYWAPKKYSLIFIICYLKRCLHILLYYCLQVKVFYLNQQMFEALAGPDYYLLFLCLIQLSQYCVPNVFLKVMMWSFKIVRNILYQYFRQTLQVKRRNGQYSCKVALRTVSFF